MNHQPDKLFREKFESFQRPVSANAWSRVEARLDNKKDKGLLLKIAASLIFLAVAGIVIWQWSLNRNDSQLTKKTDTETQTQSKSTDNEIKNNSTPPPITPPQADKNEAIAESGKPAPKEQKKSSPKKSQERLILPERTVAQVENKNPEPIIEKIEVTQNPVSENPVVNTEAVIVAGHTNEQKEEDSGVTLVYSAEEVNDKYLDKKALAEATSDAKKPSTLRKLWNKASDLKNNQEAFGDLRQKKNEILALNFIGEKRSKN